MEIFKKENLKFFLGKELTKTEIGLNVFFILLFPCLGWIMLHILAIEVSFWQKLIFSLFILDLGAGVFTNASKAAKNWYHREGRELSEVIIFNAIHLHPFIFCWVFGLDFLWAVYLYFSMIALTLIVIKVPQYIQLPIALTLSAAVICLMIAVSGSASLFVIFSVLYILKLVTGHSVEK